jgi:HTH-type transcriptional regulator/antitoxin HigA
VTNNRYFDLVRKFPLRPIRNDEELDRATAMIDSLVTRREPLDSSEEDYLEVLGDLTSRYEEQAHPIEPATDAEVLALLMESNGYSQTDVAKGAGIAVSTINEVLAGKRQLTRGHIGKLSKFFHVEPGVFAFGED